MSIEEAIDYFGSAYKLTAILGLAYQNITLWKNRGRIPDLQQLRLEIFTGGLLKADVGIKIDEESITRVHKRVVAERSRFE